MIKESKISVIIPVYNVEKYLRKSVESVVMQTYKNLEIILVDDGSTDSCPQMCDDLSKMDKRIIVIHKKNGGLSSARNAGLDVVSGQYVYFLDSDDYIEPETLEMMLSMMKSEDADIVVAGTKPFYTGKIKPTNFDYIVNCFAVNNADKKKLSVREIMKMPVVACGKLYKKSIIDKYNLRFDEGLINEDEAFCWYYTTKINSGAFISKQCYNYLIRSDSIMGQKRDKGNKIGDALYIVDKVYEHLIKYDLLKKYKKDFHRWAFSMILSTKRLARDFDNQAIIEKCDEYYDKYNKGNFFDRLTDFGRYSLLELLFSVKHSQDGEYKVVCIFGIKIKFKLKK